MTLHINSATYRILLSKIRSGDVNGFMAACTFADQSTWEEPDEKGRRLLHHAALADKERIIAEMLSRGARQDVTDGENQTPYMLAIRMNRRKAMAALAPSNSPSAAAAKPAASASGPASAAKPGPKIYRVQLPAKTFPGRPASA